MALGTGGGVILAVASPFKGFPSEGRYTDPAYNVSKAREIMRVYWRQGESWAKVEGPVVALVCCTDFLYSPGDGDEKKANEWCRELIRLSTAVHFHYPAKLGLSPGMREEWRLAQGLWIRCVVIPWEVW